MHGKLDIIIKSDNVRILYIYIYIYNLQYCMLTISIYGHMISVTIHQLTTDCICKTRYDHYSRNKIENHDYI